MSRSAVKWFCLCCFLGAFAEAAELSVKEGEKLSDSLGQFQVGEMKDGGDEGAAELKAQYMALATLRAAADGDVHAQAMIGLFYATGFGVTMYRAAALDWIRRSTEQGDATGQYFLGVLYAEGVGVGVDQTEALKWYRLAPNRD